MAVAFARVLRGAGLRVPLGSVLTFVSALGRLQLGDRDQVYWAGRATLVRNPEDIPLYDRSFHVFWMAATAGELPDPEEPIHITLAVDDDSDEGDDQHGEADASDDPQITLRFSAMEVLRHKDFANYSDEELRDAQDLMTQLRFIGPPRRSFRQRRSKRGRRPDLQATLRSALRTGGEPISRHWRVSGERLRRLVLLVDVSGSMEPYAACPAAVRARCRQRPPEGGGVRHRHPPHACHPRTEQS